MDTTFQAGVLFYSSSSRTFPESCVENGRKAARCAPGAALAGMLTHTFTFLCSSLAAWVSDLHLRNLASLVEPMPPKSSTDWK